MYFWENNYERALQWAEEKKARGRIKSPAVIGATLFLGHCCDFLDAAYLRLLKEYFDLIVKAVGEKLPQNRDLPHDKHKDKILRELDCAVIEYMHAGILYKIQTDIQAKGFSPGKTFDSTRGVFTEGGPVFAGAGILEKSHIQVCIRNPNCIKSFFLPRKEVKFPELLN